MKHLVRPLARLLAALAFLMLSGARAASPDFDLDGYMRTSWTQADGAPPGIVSLAQTGDGWLWLGTSDGLYRFDGVRFEAYMPAGHPELAHVRAQGVYAAANGDLYVAFFPGVIGIVHRDGRFALLPQPAEQRTTLPQSFALDKDGTLWTYERGIRRLKDGRWDWIEQGSAWSSRDYHSLLLDQDDRLWASNGEGVWRLDRQRARFDKVSDQGGGLAQSPDGAVWALTLGGGPAIRLAASASGRPRRADANTAESRVSGQFDARGTLWTLDCGAIACLVPGAAAGSRLDVASKAQARIGGTGMAQREAPVILEDREGDVWVIARGVLNRYRPKRFLSPGLDRDGGLYHQGVDGAGGAWVTEIDSGKLWRLQPGGAVAVPAGPPVHMLASARNGGLLLSDRLSIRRMRDGAVETIPLPPGPDGKARALDLLGLLDDGETIWTASPQTGAIGWKDGHWASARALGLPERIYLTQAGGPGQLWLATVGGPLYLHENGRSMRYDAGAVGVATGIFPGTPLAIGGSGGFAILKEGRFQLLRSAEPDVLRNVSGLVVSRNGDRWLNGMAGVLRVRARDWQQVLDHPDMPLRYELFGPLDGYPGRAETWTRQPTAFTGDGRHVWFLASGGIVGLDSEKLAHNSIAPQPQVLDVVTDAGAFSARGDVRLPPGSTSFRIGFTAPSLRQPKRVRFAYRLDGVDRHWQDAGTQRMTSYANVAPGDYVFRLRATNEDGLASVTEASVRLSVAPTLVQSWPFKLALALALAACAALLYQLRVRYLARRLTDRLQVKLSERERIARMLHDTILQTVQGIMLRLSALGTALPAGDALRLEVQDMLEDARRAVGEGRDQVHELRTVRTPEETLRACAAELQAQQPGAVLALTVRGKERALHPAVADDAGEVACEALRNAFFHAQGSAIDVDIDYGRRDFSIAVRDDGRGLDATTARDGYRSGHWGLVGMRERAERIGARLHIDSAPDRGTDVLLSVPAGRAYVDPAQQP